MIPAFLLAALAAVSPADEVVARVDGTAITSSMLARRLAAAAAQGVPTSPNDAVERTVNEIVLAAEARRLGMAGSPGVAARIDRQRRRAAAESFVANEVAARVEPDEKRLEQSFHATADFVSFDSLAFETKPAAEEALRRIQKGSSFSEESTRAVTSKVHARPSEAPLMMRGQLEPPVAAALFAAAPGNVVGPVQGPAGWIIARVIKKEVGTAAEFAARRPALVERARSQGTTEMVAHVVAKLRAQSGVKLDESFLGAVGERPPTRQQLDHVIATVNGAPVRYEDVYGAISTIPRGHGMGANVRIDVAWKEIDNLLLQGLAAQRGHEKAPSVAAMQPEFERAALAAALLSKIESAAGPPSEDEIQGYYRRNAAVYRRPFRDVLPEVVAAATAEKRQAAVARRLKELRSKASVSIDRNALSRAGRTRP